MQRAMILFFVFVVVFGCSNSESDGNGNNLQDDVGSDGDSDGDADNDTDVDTDADSETAGDGDGDGDSDGEDGEDTGYDSEYSEWTEEDGGECGEWDLNLAMNPSRLMLLQDLSSSMSNSTGNGEPSKWEQARNALISLVNSFGFNEMLEIGLDVFPDRQDCHAEDPLVLDAAPANGQAIFEMLSRLELSRSTPLYMAIQNFLDADYAPIFTSQDMDHYLVIVSDGMDSCGLEPGGTANTGSGASAAQLGSITADLLETHGIMTLAIGFGAEADADQLNAIARAGGTPYDEYFIAGNRDELEAVFNEIVAFTISCEFEIDPQQSGDIGEMELDMDKVNFYFNDTLVGLDKGCEVGTGWDWTDPTVRDTVQFCDQACDLLKTGQVTDISATFGCESETVIVVK